MTKQISFLMLLSLIITCLTSNGMQGPTKCARRTVAPVQPAELEVILIKDSPVSAISLLNGSRISAKKDAMQHPIGSNHNKAEKNFKELLSCDRYDSLFQYENPFLVKRSQG